MSTAEGAITRAASQLPQEEGGGDEQRKRGNDSFALSDDGDSHDDRLEEQDRRRAMGSGIWQRRQRGQAGVREGNAPAGLCRRQGWAVGAGWGQGPRYWRLGGGGKQGWVT